MGKFRLCRCIGGVMLGVLLGNIRVCRSGRVRVVEEICERNCGKSIGRIWGECGKIVG